MSVKRDLVIVTWDDARGDKHTEVDGDNLPHRPTVNQTIGWLLKDDAAGVSIVNEHVSDGDATCWRGHDFIPRGMVRSVVHFNLTTPKVKKVKDAKVPVSPPPDPVDAR